MTLINPSVQICMLILNPIGLVLRHEKAIILARDLLSQVVKDDGALLGHSLEYQHGDDYDENGAE